MDADSSVFRFREFDLMQREDVWKAGTDSVLLGSWCDANGLKTALDAGTGTGILALILAQRYPDLRIDAIDVNPSARALATQNVRASPWAGRIQVLEHDALEISALGSGAKYDLIISNPPYFPSGLQSPEQGRREARQGSGFSIYNIAEQADRLLDTRGKLAMVVPFTEIHEVIRNANVSGFYVNKRMDVRTHALSEYALSLLEFTRALVPVRMQELILYYAGIPTAAYRRLCGALYSSPMFTTGRS